MKIANSKFSNLRKLKQKLIGEKFKLIDEMANTFLYFERTPKDFENIRKQTKNVKFEMKENKKLMIIFFEIDLFLTDYSVC